MSMWFERGRVATALGCLDNASGEEYCRKSASGDRVDRPSESLGSPSDHRLGQSRKDTNEAPRSILPPARKIPNHRFASAERHLHRKMQTAPKVRKQKKEEPLRKQFVKNAFLITQVVKSMGVAPEVVIAGKNSWLSPCQIEHASHSIWGRSQVNLIRNRQDARYDGLRFR